MPEGRSTSVARGFLFADLRNYSAWVEAHGDHAAAELLREYRSLVRKAAAEFEGAEIRTEGDSFYVAFGSPSAAVTCGLRILELARESRSADGKPIPVGIGVHAGETVQTDEGYVGSAVNVAARICAQAEAGELLVSDAVRSLTRTYLDVTYVARGRRKLKGFGEPIGLYRVTAPVSSVGTTRVTPHRTARGQLPVIAGAIGIMIVILAVALIGGALVREGAGALDPSESASSVSSTSADSSTAPAPGTATGTAAFPTDAEARLLARLEDGVARHCVRADPDDVPEFRELGALVYPLAHDAGLECRLGSLSEPDTVWYWSAVPGQRLEPVDSIFFHTVGLRSIPPGDCATDDFAYGRWEFGSAEGRLLCYGSRTATLMWTYDDENLLVIAVRSDADTRALYAWWRDHARLLGS